MKVTPKTLERVAAVDKYLDCAQMHGQLPKSIMEVSTACGVPFTSLSAGRSYVKVCARLRRMLGYDRPNASDRLLAVIKKYEADPNNAPIRQVAYAREADIPPRYLYIQKRKSLLNRIKVLIENSCL